MLFQSKYKLKKYNVTLDPTFRQLKGFSFSQLLKTFILKQEIDCKKIFPWNLALQSIFITAGVTFMNNATNLKQEKNMISTHD